MIGRILTALVGVAVWAVGCVMFLGGDELVGGLVILVGGVLIIVAVQGGWSHFWEGLTNWLWIAAIFASLALLSAPS